MQIVKTLFATLFVGGFFIALFFLGIGFFVVVSVIALVTGMLAGPAKRKQWQTRWHNRWQSKAGVFTQRTPANTQTKPANVIEGEYTVKDE